jgi:hypothetical protein
MIGSHLCNFSHFVQFFGISGHEVKERKPIEIFGSLVTDFNDLKDGLIVVDGQG